METRKLADATSYIARGVSPAYNEQGVTVFNQKCVRNNVVSLAEARVTNPEKKRISSEKYVRKYDVLVNSTGVGTLGRVAQYKSEAGPATVDSHVTIVRPDLSSIDGSYFGYAMIFREPLITSMGEGATGQTELSRSRLGTEIEIPVPSLSVQRRIASVLSAYDDLVENNTRRIEILEEMAQAIYREWFVNFRFPGHEKVKMVNSEFGPIPDGWRKVQLGEVADQVRRSVRPEQVAPDTPYVGLEHIPRKSIALSEWGTAEEVQSTKLAFNKDEILFGKIRPYFHKVAVAPIGGLCSSDTIVITPKATAHFSTVLCTVSSEEFVDHATQTSQGTKMPRADWNVLVKYPVVIPSTVLLKRFNDLVEDIVNQIQNLGFRNRNLRRTRDLLLPKLISGEVDVVELAIPSVETIAG